MARLLKELKLLAEDPPPGVSAWPVDDASMRHLHAQMQGPEGTPYASGTFTLELHLPERYPFEPPKVRFMTPVFHPNIDDGGRICLDTLKMQPQGSWAPSINISTLLTTIRLLLAHPNPDDGLMPEITELFKRNPAQFASTALAHTRKHACGSGVEHTNASTAAAAATSGPVTAAASTSAAADEEPAASTAEAAREGADAAEEDDEYYEEDEEEEEEAGTDPTPPPKRPKRD